MEKENLETQSGSQLEPQEKRLSGIVKIVGATPEEERAAIAHYRELIKEPKNLEYFCRERTEEENQLILKIINRMLEFVRRYGGNPVEIGVEQVRFIDRDKLPESAKKSAEFAAGFYFPEDQAIVITQEIKSKLMLAAVVVHEILHFNSFQSKTAESGFNIREYPSRRSGLGIYMRGKFEKYFYDWDEAVTEELVKRFCEKYNQTIPDFQKELSEKEEFLNTFASASESESFKALKNNLDLNDLIYGWIKKSADGKPSLVYMGYAYPAERAKLKQVIDDIYEKHKEKFQSSEDIFNIFAKAVLTGRLKELARLVESTYGKGSFRKFGEQTKEEL